MRVAISSDHAGFPLKRFLLDRFGSESDVELVDLGVHAENPPVDYPDVAQRLGEGVARGEFDRGILVCGSGAGVSVAANKIPGVRAYFAGDTYTAHQGVEHDAGNVLCLGGRVTGTELAAEIVRGFLRADFSDEERHRRRVDKVVALENAHNFPLEALRKQGQSLWLDNISREMVTSGELNRLAWDDHVVGMTSNPTIFEKAMGHGKAYEEPAAALARQGRSAEEIYWQLAIEDIQAAADVMRPVYGLTRGLDGYISLEVAPAVANDTQGSVHMAQDLWRRLDRPNVFIKIPATREGVPAIEEAIASGVNVNVTLMFSVDLYVEVAHAYIAGLERFLQSNGRSLARTDSLVTCPVSVASFFVSRVDTLVDKMLGERIEAERSSARRAELEHLLGRAAVANARLAYQHFLEIFRGPRWEALADRGARVQRPLWASTSTKNPRYRDVLYVEDLIGPDTVNTVPDSTLRAFAEHGRVARTVDTPEAVADAKAVMEALRAAGIDMDEVTLQLQREGVRLFAESFDQLINTLEGRRQALTGSSR